MQEKQAGSSGKKWSGQFSVGLDFKVPGGNFQVETFTRQLEGMV